MKTHLGEIFLPNKTGSSEELRPGCLEGLMSASSDERGSPYILFKEEYLSFLP